MPLVLPSDLSISHHKETSPFHIEHSSSSSHHQRTFLTSSSRTTLHFISQSNTSLLTLFHSPPSWPHPDFTEKQLKDIEVAHREVRTASDWVAFNSVRFLRWCTDVVTGYRHDPNKPYKMSERKWLIRFIFLETVAGVPGMVGGMLRHYHSLRRMKRDNGW